MALWRPDRLVGAAVERAHRGGTRRHCRLAASRRPVRGGLAITPLDQRAVDVADEDDALYELLALVDAIRAGRAREVNLARTALAERLQ